MRPPRSIVIHLVSVNVSVAQRPPWRMLAWIALALLMLEGLLPWGKRGTTWLRHKLRRSPT